MATIIIIISIFSAKTRAQNVVFVGRKKSVKLPELGGGRGGGLGNSGNDELKSFYCFDVFPKLKVQSCLTVLTSEQANTTSIVSKLHSARCYCDSPLAITIPWMEINIKRSRTDRNLFALKLLLAWFPQF